MRILRRSEARAASREPSQAGPRIAENRRPAGHPPAVLSEGRSRWFVRRCSVGDSSGDGEWRG